MVSKTLWCVRALALAAVVAPACHVASAQPLEGSPTRDEVRAIVAEMLDDAQTRSSLLASDGVAAGHDGKNFLLASADGAFRLTFRAQVQFRYLVSLRNENDGNGDGVGQDDFESGFQTRRTKLTFDGSAWEKNLTYRIQAAVSRSTGDAVLEDSWFTYTWDNGLALTGGQFKLPFLRDELVGSTSSLTLEQSPVYETFTTDYGQGVQLGWTGQDVRVHGAFSDGSFTRNSDFSSERRATPAGLLARSGAGESDYGFTLRTEFKQGDKWSRFRDNSSSSGEPFAFLIGAAGHVEGGDGSSSDFTTGTYLQALWTVDATLKGNGWVLAASGVGSHIDHHGFAGRDVTRNDYGVNTEFAFRPDGGKLEPYIQHSVLIPDPERTGGGEIRAFNTFAIGANYYLHGHAAKFTADIVWRPDDDNPLLGPRTGAGYLGDDDPHEITLRLQWQLLF